jgi:peptidoglycan/LPS O-acetylase OafA/YrhL
MIKGLDGARGFSVILIVLFHCGMLELFWLAVQLFFVLSGFLITNILLRQSSLPAADYFRVFYGRRALRIFPLYYLFLLGLAITPFAWARQFTSGWEYAATYTYNLYYAFTGKDNIILSPLWTLAVEEQFYLVWPFVIYLMPRKYVKPLLIALVLLAPALRYLSLIAMPIMSTNPDVYHAVYKLPTSHIDAFAVGALLSVTHFRASRAQFALLLIAVAAYGASNVLWGDPAIHHWSNFGFPLHYKEPLRMMVGYSIVNIFWAVLISGIIRRQIVPTLFENRLLSHIGEVSYGMYLLHMPIIFLSLYLLGGTWVKPGSLAFAAANLFVTYVIASILFHGYEKPILALKERLFPYKNPRQEIAATEEFSR